MTKLLLFILLLPVSVAAQISVTVTPTSRQAIATYTAPNTNPCTVEVSESASYSPVIDDVNATLFSGSNSDARAGSLGAGTTARTFVIGTVPDMRGIISNLASDSKRYGRALQPVTTYYYRITCGAQTGTGSFTTRNRPLGMTRGDEQPMASAGVYAFPTSDEANRNQILYDPVTGIKLRKLSWPSEDNNGGEISFYASGAPWPHAQTTLNDSHGTPGYLTTFPTSGGSARLYFVTQSDTRFLGSFYLFGGQLANITSGTFLTTSTNTMFGTDPRNYYNIVLDSNSEAHVVRCQLPPSGDTYYNTSVGVDVKVSCQWSDLTPNPNNLSVLLHSFDSNFDNTKFGHFSYQNMQGDYLTFVGARGNQDSYGWPAAFNTATSTLTGATPLWQKGGSGSLSFRWCAFHAAHPILGSTLMSFTAKTMYQSGVGMGPYTLTLNGAMTDSQTTITFNSNTPTSPNADTTLYALAAGDEIDLTGEVMYLGSFVSGTTWNIATRGAAGGGAAKAHSNGETVLMGCRCHNPNDFGQVGPSFWNFITDPHGNDTTGTNLITQLGNSTSYNGHEGFANGRGLAEGGWIGQIGTAGVNNTALSISDSAQFAGASKSASGNAWQKHPGGPQQSSASASQSLVWGADFLVEDADPELSPTSFTNVTGTLFKFVNTNYTLTRKKLAMLAIVGAHPLLDISSVSTGDVITGAAGDNYKYCVANASDECRTGSSAGDIYVNAPDLTISSNCSGGGITYSNTTVICLGHIPAYGSMVDQIGIMEADATGKWIRSLTSGLMPLKVTNSNSDGHATPDGRWVSFYRTPSTGSPSIWLVQAPAWPGYDGIDRNNFISRAVTVSAVGGATEALIKFGYDTNLYPTSRQEVGVSAASNNPYFFASEAYTAVSCTSGCTISVPVIPDRVAYYQIIWRDSGHNVVATGNMAAITDTGTTTSIQVCKWSTNPACQ